jgi:methyltransferase (TIGR00027 family)
MSLDPIAKTAYYCCGVRALDARSTKPLCGDLLAERFMTEEVWRQWQPFASLKAPNQSNAARHRVVDDWLRERLARDPSARILLLGAGFDTRAFRLSGGDWLELDQPSLIALKEQVLPAATAPNRLQRLGIDFVHQRLADVLGPWVGRPGVTVVMEGVSMYLDETAHRENARALHELLPGHTLICDLMDETFSRRFGSGLRSRIRAHGGDFQHLPDDPAGFLAGLGYRELRRQSIPERMAALMGKRFSMWLMGTPLLRPPRDGYRLYEFQAL